jgi:hypothetical protein
MSVPLLREVCFYSWGSSRLNCALFVVSFTWHETRPPLWISLCNVGVWPLQCQCRQKPVFKAALEGKESTTLFCVICWQCSSGYGAQNLLCFGMCPTVAWWILTEVVMERTCSIFGFKHAVAVYINLPTFQRTLTVHVGYKMSYILVETRRLFDRMHCLHFEGRIGYLV